MINNPIKRISSRKLRGNNLNILITGGSRGLGGSLAKKFLDNGDNVYITCRNINNIDKLKHEIPDESINRLYPIKSDASDLDDIQSLSETITRKLDGSSLDILICNAGISGGYNDFKSLEATKIKNIVDTNLLGTMLTIKEFMPLMKEQPFGGSIFTLSGAGGDHSPSPLYSVYGATKAGIVQFTKTLQCELRKDDSMRMIDLHIISPGMMNTDLLLDNINDTTYDIISPMIADPEIVALHLTPRIRNTYYQAKVTPRFISFLTPAKIIYKMVMSKVL